MSRSKFKGWIASLSDGTTVFEGRGHSWSSLTEHCEKEELTITRLRLQCGGITVLSPLNAEGYTVDNKLVMKDGELATIRRGIGYISGGQIYMVFVDEAKNVFMESLSLTTQIIRDHSKLFINKQ